MSPANEALTDFERNARLVLEQSVTRIDARMRSRLNQARQAALAAAAPRRWWSSLTLMPAAGAAAAAVLVAVMLWHAQPGPQAAPLDARAAPVEDMDLLADGEGLDLVGEDGSFYEWAAAQTDGNGESEG